jgi:hypothetical protein
MMAKAKAKAEATAEAAKAKAAELDEKHSLSEKAASAKADASAKASAFDEKHSLSEKAASAKADASAKASAFDEKHNVSEKATAAKANVSVKAAELDEKYQISEKAGQAKADASAKATELDEKYHIGEKAAAAKVSASEAATSAGESLKKAGNRAKNITPEEKAKLMAGASSVLTVASVICPAARGVGLASKGMMAATLVQSATESKSGTAIEPMTCQLVATANAGETMVFTVDGYAGDYAITVPAGVTKGETFDFDGDLSVLTVTKTKAEEGVPPPSPGASTLADQALSGASGLLGNSKMGKQLKMAQASKKVADDLGIKVTPKQAMQGAKLAAKASK